MSGTHTQSGETGSSLAGRATRRERRERGDAALRRARARYERARVVLACTYPRDWERCLTWQLAWENEILRYRDGNNNDDERTDDDRPSSSDTAR